MRKKAIIISLGGFKLTNKERYLISNEKPWGIILFRRNIKSFKQLRDLINQIRDASNDKKFPVQVWAIAKKK